MVVRLIIFAVPAAIVSALAMGESLQGPGLVSGILAIALLAVGALSTSSTLARLALLLRPFLVMVLAVPALWIVLQLVPLPLPLHGLGNPIWATASAALNQPLAERFTVDVPATMLALSRYNIVVAAALITAAVTLDRHRAAEALYVLGAITAALSALAIWSKYSGSTDFWLGERVRLGSTAAGLGLILSTAIAVQAIDQLRRAARPPNSPAAPIAVLTCAILSFMISAAAIPAWGSSATLIAALLGLLTLLSVVAIRKWFFGVWGRAGVIATTGMLFVTCLTFVPIARNTDPTVALSAATQVATERMLQDIRPIGTGAGTVASLMPIYRDIGMSMLPERPTAAASIAIEMGRTFLFGLLMAAAIGTCFLFKRSLSRSYAYVYPAAGAGAAVMLFMLAFAEDTLLELYASVLIAAIYGLAFAQSLPSPSREIRSLELKEFVREATGRAPTARPAQPPNSRTTWIRAALIVVGLVLAVQTAWILSQSRYFGDALSASSFARLNDAILTTLAVKPTRDSVRTDRESTAATQLDSDKGASLQGSLRLSDLNAFIDVLHYSPLRGDAWLTLAAVSKKYAASYDTTVLLKMSYYTAPNELDLIPLRLSVALNKGAAVNEPELRDLIRRDLKVAMTSRSALWPAIVAAYQSAPTDARVLVESSISELDPNYLPKIRARSP